MKNLFWITLMLPLACCAQVSDDFESGVVSRWILSPPGHWAADNTNSISGAYSLHHIYDNSEAGTAMAGMEIGSLRSDLGTVTWDFKIKHGCDPSSSNNWGVFLISDSEPSLMRPGVSTSGYIVGVNLTGYDDTLRIWKSEPGNMEIILTTNINWQTDIGITQAASISISRTTQGEWSLALGVGDIEPVFAGEGSDPEWFSNLYFGLIYKYTSTRDQLLWLDDLKITAVFIEDNQPPEISSSGFLSASTIFLNLNEPASGQMSNPENFILMDKGIAPLLVYGLGNQLILEFPDVFENKKEYILLISKLCDLNNNCSSNVELTVQLAFPEWGDIVVSEFMADPDPPVKLPDCEYIELYNSSGIDFDLCGVSLAVGIRKLILPSFNLSANGYILLSDDYCDWGDPGAVELLKLADFPTISNNGTMIVLADSAGSTIYGLEFSASWYNSVLKAEGGWSMEMIDTDYPFQSGENWRFSTARDGGTPGAINSVDGFNPDITSPWIDNVYPESDTVIVTHFSEAVRINASETGLWGTSLEVRKIVEASPLRISYRLSLKESLVEGARYILDAPDKVSDFNSNPLSRASLGFGLPENPVWNDLVINEILFDALPGESEFIEIYNRSGKILDASRLFMVSVNLQTGDTGKAVWLSETPRCIMPDDYFAIAASKESVIDNYTCSDKYYIFETGSFPSLPDDKGLILLMTREHDIIDRVEYSEKMHFDLLSGSEGVSLERIDVKLPSDTPSNWHSASGLSGWGTPGKINSMVIESVDQGAIKLSSRKISPDNDGFEDVLQITVSVPETGAVLESFIFNDMGNKVRTLTNLSSAGGENIFYWDGTTDSGSILPRGIYILFVEIIRSKGNRSIYREVCAIVR